MLVMTANASGSAFHRLRCTYRTPHTLGWLLSPESLGRTSLRHRVPFAVDNCAWTAFLKGTPWNGTIWRKMLRDLYIAAVDPLWVLVPDVVADREATLENWETYAPQAAGFNWPLAFAVQDGMTAADVPSDADVIFIGGTTEWKWMSLHYWCQHFPRVHVGRVNTVERLQRCFQSGAESCDGTGWMRRGNGDRVFRNSWADLERWLSGGAEETWFLSDRPAAHPPICPECGSVHLSFDCCANCGAKLFSIHENN